MGMDVEVEIMNDKMNCREKGTDCRYLVGSQE